VQKITAPPLFHGSTGACFVALAFGEIVSVTVPDPPLVSVIGAALAVTSAAVPFDDAVTEVVNETVPAYPTELSPICQLPLLPALMMAFPAMLPTVYVGKLTVMLLIEAE